MTRDSKFWWLGMIGAVIVGISSRMDVLDLVLPIQHKEKIHAVIEILALIVATVSGKMATSPLKGEHDDDTVAVK